MLREISRARTPALHWCVRVFSRFLLSASDVAHFPSPSLPEIAFLGRSNVGKSSVINFFELRVAGKPRPELIFTDLPGYGYAKLSREVSAQWPQFIDPYLRDRPTLALCLALVDSNIPPQESDQQLLEFLTATGRPFVIVATKSDRLSGNTLRNALRVFEDKYPGARIVPFSAKTGTGREELWREIRTAAEALTVSPTPSQSRTLP